MGSECTLFARVTPGGSIAGSSTDFFTVKSTGTGSRIVTISVSLSGGVKLYARLNGTNCVMNSDTALTADALYTFSLVVSGSDTLTFRASAACTCNYFVAITSIE